MDVNVASPALRQPAASGTGATLGLAQISQLLRRNIWLIAILAAGGAAGAYVYASGLEKSYTATSAVAVEGDRITIPELRGALSADTAPDPMPWVHTEVQALSSRELVQGVVTQLHMDQDPEFNAGLRPPTLFGRIKSSVMSLLPHHNSTVEAGSADDGLLGAVNRALAISQDNRSLVIGVAFTSHHPKLSSDFVNTLIQNYIDGRAHHRAEANTGANEVVTARIEQVRRDIDAIEQKMRDLREKSDLVGLRAGSVGQQQVEDLATAASQATMARSQIEANWQRASALAGSGSSDALASVLGSETISRLRQEESEASAKVADLSQRYGPNYPTLKSAQADLASDRRQVSEETHRIVASLSTQLTVARAHEADMLAQLNRARHAGVTAQNTQAQLDQLAQDAATRRDLYRNLLERAQQTESQPRGSETPDLRILSKAVPPGLPSAPNMKLATGFGGLGGGILGCLLALVTASVAGARFDPEAFARLSNVSVVGSLRRASRSRGRLAEQVLAAPSGPEAETMRVARERLRHIGRTAPRVVGFAEVREGTLNAAVAAAFARVAAMDGQRVLLVDNGNGTSLARALGGRPGQLGAVFLGEADWRDSITTDRVPSLDVLLNEADTRAGSGGAARSAVGFENLLAEAKDDYDLIVLGGANGSGGHATAVARRSDVTVLLVDAQATDPQAAAAAVASISALSRSPVAALLLTSQS